MLLKLFKYDFKKLSRVGLPCLIAVLCITVIGCIDALIFGGAVNHDNFSIGDGISSIFSFLGLMGMIMSLTVVVAVITIMIYVRFYRSTATDEAYLTMTLPVTADQIIISKVLSASLWLFIISTAIVVSAASIISCLLFLSVPELMEDLPLIFTDPYIRDLFSEMSGGLIVYLILALILALVQSFETLLQVFAAITVGSAMTKKYKGFASVLAILVANFLVSSVVSMFTIGSILNIDLYTSEAYPTNDLPFAVMNTHTVVEICVYLGLAVAFYFICRHYLSKRVNLD
ncbi:MAG: hypothetical protein E7672_01370 [Ruminococcaceae bacterium]|nr:hypothetical protein [Oscillospiraceae bacterium]